MQNKPKNVKFQKIRKGNLKKSEFKSNFLKFGKFGLKAAESGILSVNQLESCRQIFSKKTKRKGKIWITVFPYISITAKPIGTRMGKGKGKISHWGAKVKKGNLIIETDGFNKKLLIYSLKSCQTKLPIKTKLCKK